MIRYYHLESVDSTNTWAKEHAHEFSPDVVSVISATEQTGGRGRYSRTWISPKGQNLTFSFALFPTEGAPFTYCQLASLALQEFLHTHGIAAQIKWPNDLLVNGKKIAGLLTEHLEVNNTPFIVLGIGLNVNMNAQEVAQIPQAATSMALESGKSFSCEPLLESFTKLFIQWLDKALENHFADIDSLWQKNLVKMDKPS
jgi:BirA family biotin operon repressor/biotin-[acetyl-CoA-carboxylase] ligase